VHVFTCQFIRRTLPQQTDFLERKKKCKATRTILQILEKDIIFSFLSNTSSLLPSLSLVFFVSFLFPFFLFPDSIVYLAQCSREVPHLQQPCFFCSLFAFTLVLFPRLVSFSLSSSLFFPSLSVPLLSLSLSLSPLSIAHSMRYLLFDLFALLLDGKAHFSS